MREKRVERLQSSVMFVCRVSKEILSGTHTHHHHVCSSAYNVQDVNMDLYMFILPKAYTLILKTCKTTCLCECLTVFVT